MNNYDKTINFEGKSSAEVAALLNTDLKKGLSEDEAKARLAKFGPNKLKDQKQKSIIRIFFEQMKNPMIYILFIAIAITIGVSIYETISAIKSGYSGNIFLEKGSWPDVIIITAVIIINSIIGTVQETKANSSLEALKKLSSPLVNVLRDGKISKIKSSELVIGDIVVLSEGDIVGADMRLLTSYNLKINESALTGESVPSEKNADIVFSKTLPIADQINMAYSSTIVTYGRGSGIVVRAGMDTEIGKIANSLSSEKEELTPLQKTLEKLSSFLGFLTIIIVVLVFAVNLIWIFVDGKGGIVDVWINSVLSSVALAVAAIPEGLVAVVTIVLAIGVTRMVKANAIIRKLPSVETLGSVTVICSDKTGTLTQNRMTVVSAYADGKIYSDLSDNKLNFLATGLALCSDATTDFGDPTEIALINFASNLKLLKSDLEKANPRIAELPFDSVRKMMSTKNGDVIYTKGALDSILSHTSYILQDGHVTKISQKDIDAIYNINQQYAAKALRVLALAYSRNESIVEENLIFVGLVAMIDPPRAEVKDAVNTLKGAGIRTVMITGDHIDTAYAIAKALNIAEHRNECLSGVDVDKLSFEELCEKVKTIRVFARVSPQNKTDVVKAIKTDDNVVAMTGDGVNDAPSLKAADIGIAMGITGTDVAKDASDMILTDDNFASIEKAVEEGRGIYANIRKTVLFLLSSNMSEVFVMFVIICIGLPAPLIAIHLLWVNLLTDSMPAIALGMDPKDENVMHEKPRDSKKSFLSDGGLKITLLYGIVITISVLIGFLIPAWMRGCFSIPDIKNLFATSTDALQEAQTVAFTTLAFSELFHMLGMSNTERSVIHIFKGKNKMMYLAFAIGVALQIFVVMVPGVNAIFKTYALSWDKWLIVVALSILPLIVHEIVVLLKRFKEK